jgi:hypothetical protein
MFFHQGLEYQRGRGIGSLFTGLFRTLFPIAKSIGKRLIGSNFVKDVSATALDAGKSMVKNIAADVLSGKKFSDSANEQLDTAKKKVSEAIRSRGRGRKRKNTSFNKKSFKKLKYNHKFNLLE